MKGDRLIRLERLLENHKIDEGKIYDAAIAGEIGIYYAIKKGTAFSMIKNFIDDGCHTIPENLIRPVCQKSMRALLLPKEDCEVLALTGESTVSYFNGGLIIDDDGEIIRMQTQSRNYIPGLFDIRHEGEVSNESHELILKAGLYNADEHFEQDKELIARAINQNIGQLAVKPSWGIAKLYGDDKQVPEDIRSKIEEVANEKVQGNELDISPDSTEVFGSQQSEVLWENPVKYQYALGVYSEENDQRIIVDRVKGIPAPQVQTIDERHVLVLESQIKELFAIDEELMPDAQENTANNKDKSENQLQESLNQRPLKTLTMDGDAYNFAKEITDKYFDEVCGLATGKYHPSDLLYLLVFVSVYSWEETRPKGHNLKQRQIVKYLQDLDISRPKVLASLITCDHSQRHTPEKGTRAKPVTWIHTEIAKCKNSPWRITTLHDVLTIWKDNIQCEKSSREKNICSKEKMDQYLSDIRLPKDLSDIINPVLLNRQNLADRKKHELSHTSARPV